MKAYVLHGIGDLRYEDRPLPALEPGWAQVKVLAAGICSSDIPRIFEKGTYRFPTIPGHEFCGVVTSTASAEDRHWIGKRVGIFPLIPCKACVSCQRGEYETCEHYDYLGSRRDGGFAEYAAVPVWNLVELPEMISDEQGALLEPAAVALHAVRRAEVFPGAAVCVVGTGAIGILAGQWARILGAGRVIVKGRSAAKREIVRQCGLEYLEEIGTDETFDRVVEAVGSEKALEESILATAPGGRVILMGNPDGPRTLPQMLYWRILRKQLTLVGTWNSCCGRADSDWERSVRALSEGRLQTEGVVSHVLEDLREGLAMMQNQRETICKIVVKF